MTALVHWSTLVGKPMKSGLNDLFDKGASVVKLTECAAPERRKLLRVFPGTQSYQGADHLDECAIIWDKDYAKLIKGFAPPVTNLTFERGGGQQVRIQCCTVVLETEHGRELHSTMHTVSSAADSVLRTKNRTQRARVHVSVLSGHAKHVRAIMEQFKLDKAAVSADWNVPLQKLPYRLYVNRMYDRPDLHLNLGGKILPTFGPARYDATLFTKGWGQGGPMVLDRVKGHDHKPELTRVK